MGLQCSSRFPISSRRSRVGLLVSKTFFDQVAELVDSGGAQRMPANKPLKQTAALRRDLHPPPSRPW